MQRAQLDFRCGRTGQRFTVNLVRQQGEQRYIFESAVKGFPLQGLGGGQGKASPLELSSSDILWIGFACPYGCQAPSGEFSFLQCSCGALSCSGGVKKAPSGAYYSTCPSCKQTFEISGTIEKYRGRPVEPSPKGLAPGTAPQKLTSEPRRYLPRGK